MALQSQTLRTGARSQFMSNRRRRRGPSRWLLVAIGAIAAAWWMFVPSGEDASQEDAAIEPAPAMLATATATTTTTKTMTMTPTPAALSVPAAAPTAPARSEPTTSLTPPPARPATPTAAPATEVIEIGRPSSAAGTPPTAPSRAITTEATAASTPVAPKVEPAIQPGSAPKSEATPKSEPPPTNPPVAPQVAPARSTPSVPPVAPPLAATSTVASAPQASSSRIAILAGRADQDPVKVRAELTDSVVSGGLSPADLKLADETLARINARLVFSPEPVADDPFARIYQVKPGDSLERIAKREAGGNVDWRFLQRINKLRNPNALQVNQKLKVPVGAFHAVVHKKTYRLDLFLVEGDDRVLVASFPVGLGELNSTPEGIAEVRDGSKLIDPEWYSPRTGEYFAAKDPKNPIGEHWIGLVSKTPGDKLFDGYGIHGTIEPDSIGKSMSMGCVRLRPTDVEMLYEVLTDAKSTVEVRP
ncbi:MAG: LysM peptidoglycan-binding domain-containing protein [Phycisphaerae bacterium]|nr:LysM peptidoglycan-binding domain-containing protein [Phycisphaerae bacterium]